MHEVARERAQSFLKPEHQQRILAAYQAFADEPGFADGRDDRGGAREGRQPVDPALRPADSGTARAAATQRPQRHWAAFDASGREFWQQMDALVDMLDGAVAAEAADA